jgi:integrase
MQPPKLTNENVRTLPAKTDDTLYADADTRNGVPGLFLRVRKGGSRTFIIKWRQGAMQRRAVVGKVGVLSLDDARKAARKLIVGIHDGGDPVSAKAKSRVKDGVLFQQTAAEYLAFRTKDMKPLSLDQCRRHLELYWKPLNRMAVAKIDRATIAAELRAIAKERGDVAADRSRSTLSALFAWCIGEGYRDDNPVMGTNKSNKDEGRERVLTDDELVKIWRAAPNSDYGRIVRLLMLTGQRRDEIANLQWSEIDSKTRLIALPAPRTKNSRPHDVPLSAPAMAILMATPMIDDRPYVFGTGNGGYSGFSRSKERLDVSCKVQDWTLHDMRRTMATRMADLGVEPHIIEAVLNHVSGHKAGVAGVYNRSTYATQKRQALELWGEYVLGTIAKAGGASVFEGYPRGGLRGIWT